MQGNLFAMEGHLHKPKIVGPFKWTLGELRVYVCVCVCVYVCTYVNVCVSLYIYVCVCREDCASLSSDHSRLLAFSARYALNTCVMQGLARHLRRHSHFNSSRADQNQTELDRLSSAQVLRTLRLYLFTNPDSLTHFDHSSSLSTRPFASLLS